MRCSLAARFGGGPNATLAFVHRDLAYATRCAGLLILSDGFDPARFIMADLSRPLKFSLRNCSATALCACFVEKLGPAEFLQFVHGALFPCACVRDECLFQLRVVSRQEAAAFRLSTASAQAFRCLDLCFRVHVTIKILASIPLFLTNRRSLRRRNLPRTADPSRRRASSGLNRMAVLADAAADAGEPETTEDNKQAKRRLQPRITVTRRIRASIQATDQ